MKSDYRTDQAFLGLSSPTALEGFLEAEPDAIVVANPEGEQAGGTMDPTCGEGT